MDGNGKIDAPVRFALVTDLHSCYYGKNQSQLVEMIDKGHPDQELIKYRKIKEYNGSNIYDHLPCFVCPSFNECKKTNLVNPIDCFYNKYLFNDNEE